MFEIKSLVSRNIKIFIRDKTAVFFSFLSVIIMLALYFLFIGKQYTSSLDGLAESKLITFVATSQMMGGILIINTLSLSLGMMGNLITDLEQHLLEGFLVTPVKRYKIIVSYYLSGIIVTFVLSILMWIITILYVGVATNYWYSVSTIVSASLFILLSTIISSSVMIYITTLLKSVNAFGTVSGVLGTFVGFVSGIYMPLSTLGDGITYISSVLPFTHLSIGLKRIILKEPFEALVDSGIPEAHMAGLREAFGYEKLGIFGVDIPLSIIFIIFIGLSVLLLYLAFRKMVKRIENV